VVVAWTAIVVAVDLLGPHHLERVVSHTRLTPPAIAALMGGALTVGLVAWRARRGTW